MILKWLCSMEKKGLRREREGFGEEKVNGRELGSSMSVSLTVERDVMVSFLAIRPLVRSFRAQRQGIQVEDGDEELKQN